MAGCFAWDLDEKPVPWMPDPEKEKPSIGQVVYYSSKQPAQPAPAVYRVGASAPAARARYEEPAPRFREDDGPPPSDAPAVRDPAPPPTDAAPAGDPDLEDRLSRLESRLEELYQIILRSYESKKRK
jgi:hypothetical protein